jgi:GAF domain-containing protein
VVVRLARRREENDRLRAELEALDSEYQRFTHRCIEIEAQNEALANLYVANFQLHTSLEPEGVTHAIKDIVEGLIGASQWALFERDAESGDLVLKAGEGVSARFPTGRVRADEGQEGRAVQSGRPLIGGSGIDDEQVALLPLTADGECVGLIAIYRMLAHKRNGYSPIDYELLNLLSGQAANALASSRLFAARLRTVQPI